MHQQLARRWVGGLLSITSAPETEDVRSIIYILILYHLVSCSLLLDVQVSTDRTVSTRTRLSGNGRAAVRHPAQLVTGVALATRAPRNTLFLIWYLRGR